MQAEVFTHPVKEYNGIVDRIPHDGKCCCDELLVNIQREWKPSVKYGKDRKQYEYVMEQCYQGAHSELPASEPGQHEQKHTNQRQQDRINRSEEHTSELQSLMRISYAVFCLKKKKTNTLHKTREQDNNRVT